MAKLPKLGAVMALDGEAEFRNAIEKINKEMSLLGSETKKVTSEFIGNSDSADALTAKNEVLTKKIKEQNDAVSKIREALERSKQQYGENSDTTKEWQKTLNYAEADLNKLNKEVSDNEKKINDSAKGFKDMGDEVEKSKDKVSNFGAAFGKIMAGIAAATAAAGVALVKNVIENFSELEQNIGGAEAVFGEYSNTIKTTGAEAYKTLGASQSEYLATANIMGALFQGSGIDQEKSLNLTIQAMQRAADMASVMGIDTQVALDSIAGAAKGNFTMMDNLGVAMNATNIEAYALAKGLSFTWNTATQSEKAEIAMQMFFESTQQYAGNFAKESTQTISGSIGMMKAAMSSFIAGLGDSNADMTLLTSNVIDSFNSVMDNVKPVVENITKALPEAFTTMIRAAGELLPVLLDTVVDIFNQVMAMLISMLPELMPVAVDAVLMIINTIINNLNLILETAITLVLTLVEGLTKSIPELIPAVIQAIMTIVDTLLNNLPELVSAALQMILALAKGLVQAIPQLIEAIPTIIESLIEAIVVMLPEIIMMGITLVIELGKGLIKAIPALVANIPAIFNALLSGFKSGFEGFKGAGGDIVRGLWEGIKDATAWLMDKISGFGQTILDGIKDFFGINSPSTVLDAEVGVNLALGVGGGYEREMQNVKKQMQEAMPTSMDLMSDIDVAGTVAGNNYSYTGRPIILQIGVYIGDDNSLKQLERKLKTIRINEDNRLGALA